MSGSDAAMQFVVERLLGALDEALDDLGMGEEVSNRFVADCILCVISTVVIKSIMEYHPGLTVGEAVEHEHTKQAFHYFSSALREGRAGEIATEAAH